MAKFIGYTANKYGNEPGTPVLVFIGKSVNDPCESVEPYDDSPQAVEMAEQWSAHIAGPGKDWTIGQLGISLGDLKMEDGSTPPSNSEDAVAKARRGRPASSSR